MRALALALAVVALGTTILVLRATRGGRNDSEERPATASEAIPAPASAGALAPAVAREAAREEIAPAPRAGPRAKPAAPPVPPGPRGLLRVEVVERETERPIEGVRVQVQGGSTTSDANGRAELSVPAGSAMFLMVFAWSGLA